MANLEKIVEDLSSLTVLEAAELSKLLEEKWGVSAAKVVTQYAKDNEKFVIVGGIMGETVLDAKAVDALAKLPSLDQLRAKLVGLIQAPATRIAGVIQAPAAQLARVFSAYAAKDAA